VTTVQRSHDTDAREHRWSVKFRDQQQRFHRGLPLIGIVFCLGQFRDVLGGIRNVRSGCFRPGNMIGSKNS